LGRRTKKEETSNQVKRKPVIGKGVKKMRMIIIRVAEQKQEHQKEQNGETSKRAESKKSASINGENE
jgi:hypothetical protein